MNIAELTIECLEMAGVRRIYGVVGDSLNDITETLRKRKSISWVPVRHEEVAAFASQRQTFFVRESYTKPNQIASETQVKPFAF